ncbi:MAG: hypothetical protein HY673_02805 [Chloroflexi bacterium]|nr:hypothetical protein [Chloroflexota bacterium]
MITDPETLQQFEDELIRNTPVDYLKNLEIVEAMYEEAVALGVFPLADPMDGIDTDIKLARAINSV